MNLFTRPNQEIHRSIHRSASGAAVPDGLLAACSRLGPAEACAEVASAPDGLSGDEAATRLKTFGPNLVARERKPTIPEEIWNRARNPLNTLLLTLAVVSSSLGDIRAAIVIAARMSPSE
jgi:Mg2+-importing ATPase